MIRTKRGVALHFKNFVRDTSDLKRDLDDQKFPEPPTFMGHPIPRQCIWYGHGKYKFGGRNYHPQIPVPKLRELGIKLANKIRPILDTYGIRLTEPQAHLVNKYLKEN